MSRARAWLSEDPDRTLRAAIAVVTILAGVLYGLDLGGPIRVAVIVLFVLVAPGLSWARLLRVGDAGDLLGLGIAMSIALAAVVGQTMALVRWWSPGTGYLVLAGVAMVGVTLEPRGPEAGDEADGDEPTALDKTTRTRQRI